MVDVIDAMQVPRFDADTLANPNKELRSVFDQYGVLLIEGFLEADDCIQMRAEADRLVARADLPADPSVFSTVVKRTHHKIIFLVRPTVCGFSSKKMRSMCRATLLSRLAGRSTK